MTSLADKSTAERLAYREAKRFKGQYFAENKAEASESRSYHAALPKRLTADQLNDMLVGKKLEVEAFEKSAAERQMIEDQTARIAQILDENGYQTKQGYVTEIGFLSEECRDIQLYRNVNILPAVQTRNHHDSLVSLQYFLETSRAKRKSMWVISSGWVTLQEYRDQHQALVRRVSKLASNKRLKDAGIKFSFTSVENTFCDQIKDDGGRVIDHKARRIDGELMLNLHAHILVTMDRYMPKDQWLRLLEWVRARFPKGYFHESPLNGKAAEVCKYVLKPIELKHATHYELVRMAVHFEGLRFQSSYGQYRQLRGFLADQGLKLRKLTDGQWYAVERRSKPKSEPTDNPKQHNIPICITAPKPTFSEVYEPCVIVKNYKGSMALLLAEHPWLEDEMKRQKAAAAARQQQDRERAKKARAPSFIKDTTTITVQQDVTDYWQGQADDPPDWLDSPEQWDQDHDFYSFADDHSPQNFEGWGFE